MCCDQMRTGDAGVLSGDVCWNGGHDNQRTSIIIHLNFST